MSKKNKETFFLLIFLVEKVLKHDHAYKLIYKSCLIGGLHKARKRIAKEKNFDKNLCLSGALSQKEPFLRFSCEVSKRFQKIIGKAAGSAKSKRLLRWSVARSVDHKRF